MNKYYKKIISQLTFASVFVSTFFSQKLYASSLVPCEGADDCGFDTFISLLNGITSFIMFRLPLILLVIVFAWNGINLIIYRDRAGIKKIIKKNLLNVVLGYLLVLGAYLIVKTFIILLAGQDLTFKVFFN